MSELTACRQPGCTGTVADGYCDVCGMPGEPDQIAAAAAPPAPAAARPAPAAAAPAPPPPVAQPSGVPPSPWRRGQAGAPRGAGPSCRQPGCTGTIVDGYCDVCGTPATPTSTMTTQPVGSGESPVEASNSQVSARLDATALGSERARSGGTISTRRVSGHSQRMRTARIGAGVTSVPPVPEIDAAKAVIKNPVVPEDKRFCPKCGERAEIFGHGGAHEEADKLGVPFLGEIPLHLDIRTTSDSGHPIVVSKPESTHAQVYKNIAGRVWKQLSANQRGPRAAPRIVVQ